MPVFTEDIDTVRQKKVVDTLIGMEKAIPVITQKEKSTQKVIAQKPAEEENVVAQAKDQQPQYNYQDATPIDGIESLYDYFDVNLKYPSEGLTDSIEGTVIVKFTVKDNGKIDNITIQKSLGDAFDIEAIRLIENMPPWKPARVNEIPIDSKLSIPLHFKVQ